MQIRRKCFWSLCMHVCKKISKAVEEASSLSLSVYDAELLFGLLVVRK